MKRIVSYLVILCGLFLFGLSSCDSSSEETATETAVTTDETTNEGEEEQLEDFSAITSTVEATRIKSDMIMDSLANPDIMKHFNEHHFEQPQTKQMVDDLIANCDWPNREGGFKQEFSDRDRAAFVYIYKLKCAELKFTLIFNRNGVDPVLEEFRINSTTPQVEKR